MRTLGIFTSVLFVLGSILKPLPALAKLAGVADLPYVVELDKSEVRVEKDGRYRLIRETLVRVVNDQGRESQSVQTLSFNSRAQSFRVIEAATLNGPPEKVIRTPVPKSDIEIKEVGEMSQAFDSIKQASLSFPAVQIGSRLKLKYEIYNKEVALKDFFSMGFSISGEYIEHFQFSVQSQIPLFMALHDPQKQLMSKGVVKKGNVYQLNVYSTSPISTVIVQEENPFFRTDRVPTVSISSLPDWTSYAKEMIPVHEKLLAAPLPPALKEIQKKAELEKNSIDQIQRVASSLAQEFRYFGDWRRRHGGYIPRSLAEISTSRYGDCKDLSLAATAIFRALGFKSNLAWVFRGDLAPSETAYKLPVDTSFNHAISRVEVDGQVFWIDATNPVAYARGVFPDIADRPAYVLDTQHARMDRTPELKPEGAIYKSKLNYEFQDDESVKVSGEVTLAGRTAISLTARAFYAPVEQVNYDLIRALSGNQKTSDTLVGDFDRGSRIVQDTTIPVKFTLAETGLRTTAGLGFPLYRDDTAGRLLVETKDRVSDIYLDTPGQSDTVMEFLNVKRVGSKSLECDLKSEWADFARKVTGTARGVEVHDTIAVRKSTIPFEVLNQSKFQAFQDQLRVCFNRAALIIEKR